MRGGETVWHALEAARRANLTEAGIAPPVVGETGRTRRAVLLALGASGVAAALPRPAVAAPGGGPVAIVGGGIAGLTALWHLTQAGIDARLYEARTRLGGRIYTAREPGKPTVEAGGQLVNTDHADMHGLCREFGVGLLDRKGKPHRSLILSDGKEVPEGKLAAALRGIAGQIDADSVRLDQDYAKVALELDTLSFTSYLDKHAALLPEPWVRRLMEATARTEYGVEPGAASAIELIFNLPAISGRRIDVLSRSDERYLIAGGSSALVTAMAARLTGRILTNRRVARIDPFGPGVRLVFSDGKTVDAANVIVTTPASITRKIDFRIPLPPLWTRFIAEVGLGVNMKVQAGMIARPWEKPIGRGGEIWQTSPKAGVASGWDGSARGTGTTGDVWTWFLGGNEVAAADAPEPFALAKRFAAQAESGIPGIGAATSGFARRTNWHRDPLSMGAYVNFRPGQLTRFGRLIWTEVDGIAKAPVPAGPVVFAGEHLSDAYPGYMNGSAQTGRLAAQSIIAGRAHARRLS
ncbi:FAD-dependent oxidoreductase [Sphingomonas sp. RB3P16]|uniref:flavin monoamine oxidase family protein n=1 Tax=Parasphingomonas frigoris TaxID=3096163 RepID=UPI002FCB2DAF